MKLSTTKNLKSNTDLAHFTFGTLLHESVSNGRSEAVVRVIVADAVAVETLKSRYV